jgi:predicted PurR-regulated permease PerM
MSAVLTKPYVDYPGKLDRRTNSSTASITLSHLFVLFIVGYIFAAFVAQGGQSTCQSLECVWDGGLKLILSQMTRYIRLNGVHQGQVDRFPCVST